MEPELCHGRLFLCPILDPLPHLILALPETQPPLAASFPISSGRSAALRAPVPIGPSALRGGEADLA